MALVKTNLASATASSASSLTSASVTLNSGDLLVVIANNGFYPAGFPVTSVTWNGLSLTSAVALSGTGGTSGNTQVGIWYIAIATGATAPVILTCSGTNANINASIFKYTGYNAATPIGATNSTEQFNNSNGVAPSLTLSTSSGDDVIDGFSADTSSTTQTVGAGQTQIYQVITAYGLATSFESASGSSVTMSWTTAFDRAYKYVAAVIKDAGITYTYARPTSDITTQWTPSTPAAPHYSMIDEVTYNDADYIYATAAAQTDEVGLQAMSIPTAGTNVLVNYRVQGITGGGSVTVSLYCGATLVKTDTTRTVNNDAITPIYTMTVTPGDYSVVTNWSDMRLRFVSA